MSVYANPKSQPALWIDPSGYGIVIPGKFCYNLKDKLEIYNLWFTSIWVGWWILPLFLYSSNLELYKEFAEEAYSIALHPSGLYVLVGFSDKLRLMNLLIDDIRTFKEFTIRGCREVNFILNWSAIVLAWIKYPLYCFQSWWYDIYYKNSMKRFLSIPLVCGPICISISRRAYFICVQVNLCFFSCLFAAS